jgi:hypothetical protein
MHAGPSLWFASMATPRDSFLQEIDLALPAPRGRQLIEGTPMFACSKWLFPVPATAACRSEEDFNGR